MKYSALILFAAIVFGAVWVVVSPPDLFRVGSNYSAKIVCSNVFLAKRDPVEVLKVDVQAPGHPLLRIMDVQVDRTEGVVKAALLGFIGEGTAKYREGFGCTPVPDGNLSAVAAVPVSPAIASPNAQLNWPAGSRVEASNNAKLDAVLANEELTGPGVRAIVIVKDGKVVGERYFDGFTAQTPMLGWSMAKTATASLVGRLIHQDAISLQSNGLFERWQSDNRQKIQLQDLLGMASDLDWNERYGSVSDVTRMLFLEPDMAAVATSPPLDDETGDDIGKNYNYSSGTSVVIARYLQDQQATIEDGLLLMHKNLFEPLGMQSAVFEADARGTLVGGSFMYASARDWARIGQFLLQKGNWQGKQLLPPGYVDWMIEPHPANSRGSYGRGHVWLIPPGSWFSNGETQFNHKSFWLSGHDSQSIGVLPDENMVIVRLGLTPSKYRYQSAKLANAVVEAIRKP